MTEAAYRDPDFETLERDDVLALQQSRLAALGQRLEPSPEWRQHFARAGLEPRDLADPQALKALPTLEKEDLRERYPYPLLTVPVHDVARFCATSGTTGLPVVFGFTDADLDLLAAQMARVFVTIGLGPEDRVYQGYTGGMWLGGVSMDLGLRALGATNFPLGPGRGELAVQWLVDQGHTAGFFTLLWYMHLATLARDRGIDPRRDWQLRLGICGGQAISKAFQDEVEALMPENFRAHDLYGSTEAGGPVVAVPCAHSHGQDQNHLTNEDSVLTEIVDPQTLEPVSPGEVGEILITTLVKQASPVLRWRTRDLVRLADKPFDCACGRRGLPLIGRVIGRSDDMLKVRGVMVFPSQIEDIVATTAGTVKEAWQIYITEEEQQLEQLDVEIECAAASGLAPEDVAETVRRQIAARLDIRARVVCHSEGTLPRYEAKAERVLRR